MSLQNLATQMAAQGRGPDRTLVHMSPREVHGLQALAMAHGGSLTINPETGLPEAGFLQDILPAVAGFALNAFAPGVGTAVGSLFGLGGAAGTALTVGGIAGLASGSFEKGIMAGMGAYGGAGLSGSLMNTGANAAVQAAEGAIPGGGPLSPAEVTAARQGVSPMDSLKSGFSAAASAPKDFLQDNKYLLGAAFLPALAGGFGDDGEGTGAPARKKYNMKYARDPVTGALYDTSGEGVTYGGVGRPTIGMAEGGPVDNRSDSEKSYDYLMGVPGAKNPMLFTHESTSAIKPADFATRKGGHYVLDAATNTYVWVPDAEDANAAAASLAAKEGLAALDRRGGGGGGGRDVDPTGNNPGGVNTNKGLIADILSSATLGRVLNALGTTQPPAPSEDRTPVPVGISKALDTLAPLDPFGDIGAPIGKALNTDPQQRAAEARDVAQAQAQAQAQAAAETNATTTNAAVATNSNVTDPAQMMQARADAKSDTSGKSDGPNGPEGRGDPGGDRGGWGRGGGYAHGGIASLAGGGLGSLGGYSDGGQLLKGPGDGVSDSIPAKIAGNQPARLADGEFVIPARIVSELGNGSTDAGARELYKMMARIQAGRAKTVGKNKTAVNSKSARHLPA